MERLEERRQAVDGGSRDERGSQNIIELWSIFRLFTEVGLHFGLELQLQPKIIYNNGDQAAYDSFTQIAGEV